MCGFLRAPRYFSPYPYTVAVGKEKVALASPSYQVESILSPLALDGSTGSLTVLLGKCGGVTSGRHNNETCSHAQLTRSS